MSTPELPDYIERHAAEYDRDVARAILRHNPLDAIQVRHLLNIGYSTGMRVARADARRAVTEQIAQAIEVADGRRCPECGGKAASTKWKGLTRHGRCGGGHTWQIRTPRLARRRRTGAASSRSTVTPPTRRDRRPPCPTHHRRDHMSTLTAQEFIRLSFEAIQERDPDLEDIEQRFVDRWGADQQAARRETLTAVLAALGRGVSPSYVVAIVAEEFGIDLAAREAS
jgi:hypothetical protein